VRAYPNNEGGGSQGQLLSLELRRALPYNLQLSGFYDLGQVSVNTHNDFAGAANPNSLRYQGVGLSLAWSGPRNSNLKASWAHRLGDNPAPVLATGNDQDGSKKLDRFWLSAVLPF
jgi:hemolysin activation/secretion protein